MPALRRHVFVSTAVAVLTATVIVGQAEVVARLLPRVIDGEATARRSLVAALVAIAIARGLLRWASEQSSTRALVNARQTINELVLRHVDSFDQNARTAAPPTRVLALTTTAVDSLEPWVRSYVPALCLAAVVPLAAGSRILSVDLISAVILLIALPLIPVFMILIGQLTEERANRDWAMMQRLAGHFHDVLVGLPTLRLFGRAEAQVERVRETADHYRRSALKTLRVAFLSAFVLELLATLSVALVAVSIGIRLADGRTTLRVALIVLLLAPECSLPLRRVGAAYHAAKTGTDAADDLDEILSLPTTADGPRAAPLAGSLIVREATVIDPERGHRVGPVDLDVAPGEVVLLRGPSGSGKTTLLDAIRGQTRLEHGEVYIAGARADELTRSARRSLIATVPQHPEPLGERVDGSVALGAPLASHDAIVEVLASVDLDSLASRRPTELSGGERQRLAVARAALRTRVGGARIVLADEPTAHLDARMSAAVAGALRTMAARGCVVLVASHDERLTSYADRIVDLAGDHVGAATSAGAESAPAAVDGVPPRAALLPGLVPGEGTGADDELATIAHLGEDLRWLRRMTRPVRGRLAVSRALGVAAEACTVGLAATAAWLIVRAGEHPSFVDLTVAAVGVRAFGIGKAAFRYAERLAAHDATFRLGGELRSAVVERLGHLVPGGLPQMRRGEMIARVVDDVDRLSDFELRIIGPASSVIAVGAAAIIGTAFADGWTAVALGAAILVGGVVLPALVARESAKTGMPTIATKGELAAVTLEVLEHADELTANDAFTPRAQRITQISARLGALERRRGRSCDIANGIAAALPAATAAALSFTASRSAAGLSGPVIGVLVLLPFALMELFAPLVTAAQSLAPVGASASRLRSLLETPAPTDEPVESTSWGTDSAADIDLADVALTWPGNDEAVLEAVNLELAEGDRILIRGVSGSGKSTLAAALVRFLAPSSGNYTLGGSDTAALGGAQVRRLVTWCMQDPWLADTTLRENLRLASPEASDDDLWEALRRVRLAEWAAALPGGLDTRLGRNAVTASGGQRQRIALARVALAGHRVVVLDEPTAHLDRATADRVLADLLESLDGKSIVLISHDTSIHFDGPELETAGGHLLGGDKTASRPRSRPWARQSPET
ncbi:MAG: thiol reductant ABC exporter subunit CydD [Acidimicrobiales bacterium]